MSTIPEDRRPEDRRPVVAPDSAIIRPSLQRKVPGMTWNAEKQRELEQRLDEFGRLAERRDRLEEKEDRSEEEERELEEVLERGKRVLEEVRRLTGEKVEAARERYFEDPPCERLQPETSVSMDWDGEMERSTSARSRFAEDEEGEKIPELAEVQLNPHAVMKASLCYVVSHLRHECLEADCMARTAQETGRDFDDLVREGFDGVERWRCHLEAARAQRDWIEDCEGATDREKEWIDAIVRQARETLDELGH